MRILSALLFSMLIAFSLSAQLTSGQLLYPTHDTYAFNKTTTTPYHTQPLIEVGRFLEVVTPSKSQPGVNYYWMKRGFLQFNLSTLQSYKDVIIVSACLELYTNAVAGSPTVYLERIGSSWSESTVTWQNQPTVTGDLLSFTPNATVNGVSTINVTSQVQKMVSGVYPNYGWRLSSNDEAFLGDKYYKCHSNQATASYRPRLRLTYFRDMKLTTVVIEHNSSEINPNGSIAPTYAQGPSTTYTTANYSFQWYNQDGAMSGKTQPTLTGVPAGWYGVVVTRSVPSTGNCAQSHNFSFAYAFLVGERCKQSTINFNPGGLFIDDGKLQNYSSTIYNNLGTHTEIEAREGTAGASEFRSMLRFRLWLDDELLINQAIMNMRQITAYSDASTTNSGAFHKVTSYWHEMQVTHSSAPTFSTTEKVILPAASGTNVFKTFDVRPHFLQWQASNSSNFGWLLKFDAYDDYTKYQRFYSSDYSTNATYRPNIDFVVTVSDDECNRIHAKLERKLTGVKYKPVLGRIYFCFDEEYHNSDTGLNYKIFRTSDPVNAVINSSITPLDQPGYGDNRYSINVNTLANGAYVLEVATSKGEKFYLRFVVTN